MKNIITALGLLVLVASFVVQRDYRFPHTNLLPDASLVVLGVLSVVLLVQGLRQRALAGAAPDDAAVDDEEAVGLWDLGRAVLLMAAWVVALPRLGFLAAGIAFCTLISLTMRSERITPKAVLMDAAVATVIVLVLYLSFTQVLYVRLPELGGQ
ncbi:tripartite tricarboxylate transporter TctB family protein [Ornithinimicrobium cavernae]|uniref:tripartite tricarboxylate transporter TctB family protein n=1 Tax=Ornithinimicrobium cavernae TaxID=2666047 RepID=UPI000D691E9A|nr:tripartite tricarboxylate transporter TctB family protein [Ornithinimicrobium cavernae]